jgi:FixJ family two-component response regulator
MYLRYGFSLGNGYNCLLFDVTFVWFGGSLIDQRAHDLSSRCPSMDHLKMQRERCAHIVDDEAGVRDALTLLLSTAQIKSRSYASAEEYLASNKLQEPACVLLDNQLPGMSGLELLNHIVATTSNSAVIMITAYGDVPTAVLAMKAGAFHFLEKPFDAEALLAAVEEALSRADEARDVLQEIEEFKARSRLLTQREREVLALLLEGLPTKLIAHRLEISARTAEHHRAAIMQKTQARNISHLLRMTLSLGHLNEGYNNAK